MITPKEQIAELADTVRLQREVMREQSRLCTRQRDLILKLQEQIENQNKIIKGK
jgi:hypothetical protein